MAPEQSSSNNTGFALTALALQIDDILRTGACGMICSTNSRHRCETSALRPFDDLPIACPGSFAICRGRIAGRPR